MSQSRPHTQSRALPLRTGLLMLALLALLALIAPVHAALSQSAAATAVAGPEPTASAAPTATAGGVGYPTNASDVWMRDNTDDYGKEPSSGVFWASPDIRACNQRYCTSSQELDYGQPVYIYVTLRNYVIDPERGPKYYPPQWGFGDLHLYYVRGGGNTQWPNGWTEIDVKRNILIGPDDIHTVEFVWNNPPAPTHYCLLARWVSPTDPMNNEGSNTSANTQNNNNIVWRNIDIRRVFPGRTVASSFTARNITNKEDMPREFKIMIEPASGSDPFPGTITLTPDVQALEDDKVGIIKLSGWPLVTTTGSGSVSVELPPEGQATFDLLFTADSSARPGQTYRIHVVQYDDRTGFDDGGVEYQITID